MRTVDGCARVLMLFLGFGLLIVFAAPTFIFGIAKADPVAIGIAALIFACGAAFIAHALR